MTHKNTSSLLHDNNPAQGFQHPLWGLPLTWGVSMYQSRFLSASPVHWVPLPRPKKFPTVLCTCKDLFGCWCSDVVFSSEGRDSVEPQGIWFSHTGAQRLRGGNSTEHGAPKQRQTARDQQGVDHFAALSASIQQLDPKATDHYPAKGTGFLSCRHWKELTQ